VTEARGSDGGVRPRRTSRSHTSVAPADSRT
jgi:hypothetical protein